MALYGRQGPKPWAKRPGGLGAVRRREDLTTTYDRNPPDASRTLSPSSPSEAEAEIRAAIEAIRPKGDGPSAEITKDPRCVRAIAALTKAVTLDKDDRSNLSAYLRRQGTRPSPEIIIKAFKRWPRIRKYWPRLRRRICSGCGKQYDLSEPRLWVCAGCGEARYCDEACQRAHWPKHERPCWEKFVEKGRERVLQGESMEKIRQEYNEWYPASQLWGNPG